MSTSRKGQQRAGGAASGGLWSGIGRGIGQMLEPENSTNNAAGGSVEEPPQPLPGLVELVEILDIMGAAPPGVRPPINQELIERIKSSPLQPVTKLLRPIWLKLGSPENPAEQPPRPEANQPSQPTSTPGPDPSSTQQPTPPEVTPNGTEIKHIEAGLQSLSSKLDSVTRAVGDVATNSAMAGNFKMLEDNLRKVDSETRDAVNTSFTTSKRQFEAVDTKVSEMSAKLHPALHEISQGINKLQVGLLGDVRAEKTRLQTRVNDLEKEVKDLQQVIDATRTELLPVEAASKIALQGSLSEEADKPSTRTAAGNNPAAAPPNVVQTAKRVRANTLGLIAKCRALFAFINRDPTTGSNVPDLGTEGEWARCADHLKTSNTRLCSAIEEKEESAQKLQFVGFVVDQIRKGRYTEEEWKNDLNGKSFVTLIEKSPDGFSSIQLLAEDISRLTSAAKAAPVAPVTPPATPASNTFASQTSTTPLVNNASADTGASTAKPNPGGTKGREKGQPSNNQPPATPGSRTPTSFKPHTGSRGAIPRVTATNSQAPAEPEEPVEPEFTPGTSTPVVTAPTSPAIDTVRPPTKHHSEIRPAPTKKSSSYLRSRSEFKRRPVSGWGLLPRVTMGKKPGKKPTGRPPQVQAPKKGPNNVNSSKTPAQQNTAQAVEPNNDDEQSEAENGPDADVPGSSGAEAKSAQLGDQTKEEPKSSGTLEELKTGQDVGQETGDEPSEVENVLEAKVNNASGAEANGAGAGEGNLGAGPAEGGDNAEEKAGVNSKENGAGVGEGNLGAGPTEGGDNAKEKAGVNSKENGAGVGKGNLGAGPGEGDDNAEKKAGVSSRENGAGTGEGAGPGEGDDDAKEKARVISKDTANDTQPSSTDNTATAHVEGLAELIQVIQALGSATDADTPRVKGELVEKLKLSPLYPAYQVLHYSWQNMVARMSAMQSGRRPLPSPPLTPKEMSNKSSSDPQHQPRNASSPPRKFVDSQTQTTSSPRKFVDNQTQTTPPETAVSIKPTQVVQPRNASPPPRKLVDHQTQTTPPETAVSIKPTQVVQPRNAPSPRQLVEKQTQTTPPRTAVSIQPTQVAPPSNSKELKALEAEITSISSKIDAMSQKMSKLASREDVTKGLGVVDNRIGQAGSQTIEQVKASTGATKTQVDKVDNTVSQLATKLDSGVSSLHQGLKQLQDSLAKRPAAPMTRPEPKPENPPPESKPVAPRPESKPENPRPESKPVNPRPEYKPDLKIGELETQVKKLHQVLDLTRAELLQADIAFKIALEGDLYEEADPTVTGTDSTSGMDSGRDTLQIARGIRTRTLRLIARCRSLFSLIVGGSADANLAIMEGEWGRCVDHLQARDRVVRKAIGEKNEAFRELQCFRFLVDQIRRGFYNRSEWKLALNAAGQNFTDLMEPTNDGFSGIQLLAQEMYRLQHSPPRKASTSSSNPRYGESRSIRSPGWALLST
ncbi:hypothetical protein FRC04_003703 [Tulasnella sp. 424]|nr:hypothetical protein FRC04_003703 [Tulasnella sp. 424]